MTDHKITLPTEPSKQIWDITKENILIYGQPGTGKSSLAAQFGKPLFIEADLGGLNKLNAYKIPVTYLHQVDQIVEELKKDRQGFTTLVFDTFTIVYQHAEKEICNEAGVDTINDIPYGRGLDRARKRIAKLITECKTLDMGLIFICHEAPVRMDVNGAESVCQAPMLHEKTRMILEAEVDHIIRTATRINAAGDMEWFMNGRPATYKIGKSRGGAWLKDLPLDLKMMHYHYKVAMQAATAPAKTEKPEVKNEQKAK